AVRASPEQHAPADASTASIISGSRRHRTGPEKLGARSASLIEGLSFLSRGAPMRSFQRGPRDLRPVKIIPGVSLHAEGSAQVEFGNTHVFVTCSVEERVPQHVLGSGGGWVTAEYGMLPRSTNTRSAREAARGKQGGRTMEIQRLIGRSMRAAVDCAALGQRTFTLDCDVLQGGGGTPTARAPRAFSGLALRVEAR